MSNQSLGKRVLEELSQAVASGLLPDSVQDTAQKLLDRLHQPVRLALMGMPRSGKSTLLNLLVGSDVMVEGVRLPTLELTYGEIPQTVCTLPDGSRKTLPTTASAEIAALSPVFLEMQMPLPALGKISVLEVVAPDDLNAIHRASQWAAKRCDVALWCTQNFNDDEQRIWATMPDLIKDHAFCMVTRADTLKAGGILEATLSAVNHVARDEFHQILPIATCDALAARQADGTVNRDKMRESGGLALISAVLKQVELGRRSAVDMAEVLLHQHADVLSPAQAVTTPEPVQEAPPAPAVPRSVPKAVETSAPSKPVEPVIEKAAVPDGITRLRALAAERSGAVAPEPKGLKQATRETYKQVIAYIEDQGEALVAALEELGDAAPAEVIAQSVENIQWLCDYLNENGDESDESLRRARDTAFDAADLVQLMQMERRDSAALEAVSLMLQIKRELQADLVA